MKNYVLGAVAAVVATQSQLVSAAGLNLTDKSWAANSLNTGANITTTITGFITFIAGFLYFISVLYALYGGFLILTAAGDEEKVKKGKTVIIHAIIGLIVIFLAANIMAFVISIISGVGTGGWAWTFL